MTSTTQPALALTTTPTSAADLHHHQTDRITIRVGDGVIVLTAIGRIDRLTAARLREDLLDVWPACAGILTVDLSACTYLSIDAVHALQEIWRRPTRAYGRLRVIANHPDVIAALDAANIPRVRTARGTAPAAPTVAASLSPALVSARAEEDRNRIER
ncbi:STAS domain-containing protein [Kribbella qitaiheensis]|uniref:STAS domain-containing protein n=1 Tax=Kribbella qitaiheensis TaxID=1544730 RepID=A0A7G6WWA3_9ACTN|nr:STAS domain-containing protein [Kribbella qitaiheensis]QNE18268.1 STAS domain-containing protein [Kribbella qitaiheensis]